jgi:predicted 2-oxoglutarate/Fe(II)-dependent dioxygenase YbiX
MHRPVFHLNGFLDAGTCRRIRHAMDRGTSETAEILHETFAEHLDVRRAQNIDVDPGVLHDIEWRLDNQRHALDEFFEVTLGEREGASLLRYTDGGFYRPHRDRAIAADWPGAARRLIAVVAFLNSSRTSDERGDFSGGDLQLFVDSHPFDVHPLQGLLVAFPADVLHQVTVVRDGLRDTVVDWFY